MKHHQDYFCYLCSICCLDKNDYETQYKSKNTKELNDHVRKEHPISFPCDQCDKIFEKKQSLYEHYRAHKPRNQNETNEHSPQTNYPCDQEGCNFAAKDVRNLVKHIIEKHTNPAPAFKCDQCDHAAQDIGALNNHKITMHGQPLGQSMSMEMFKTFFDLIHDALVETNETKKC